MAPAPDSPDGGSTPLAAPRAVDADALVERLRGGDRRALARAITLVENRHETARELVRQLYGETGDASIVGVTGAPGAGKSSLVGAIVRHVRREERRTVGIVTVDPSSPFTHGALLGDRIRLSDHFLDPGVFIRSMGTRGHLGGLAEATLQAALLMDAFGLQELFVETVGVGQSEIEVASLADTILLVLMPGSGDAVQALKAGIMEIPDIIVINKADHPAAREMHTQVRSILQIGQHPGPGVWTPPIVETQAINDVGIDTLWQRIGEHRAFLAEEGRLEARRRHNLEREIHTLASARAMERIHARVAEDPRLRELLDAVHRRELDPLTCTTRLFEEVFGG
jgi:LAO/AO transport system kinase